MPDTLVSLTAPAHPETSTAAPAPSSVPFDATDVLARLYREARAAEAALDESKGEAEDGPLHEGYHSAFDRFMDAPVNTVGDVLLKIEAIAEHEDIEAKPNLIINRILLNLLRDLRATDAAHRQLSAIEAARRPCQAALSPDTPDNSSDASTLDLVAIHREADEQVDEIYSLLKRMDGGLLALREIGESVCAGPDEWNKLRFVIDGVSDIADDLLTANDAITNAIDPLNPTVLDGVAT